MPQWQDSVHQQVNQHELLRSRLGALGVAVDVVPRPARRLRAPDLAAAAQAQRALVPQGPAPARQPQPARRRPRRHHAPMHLHPGPVVRRLLQRRHQQVEVLIAMPGRFGPQSPKVQLSSLRSPRATSRCTSETVQGMGHNEFDIRRRSRTLWTRKGSKHNGYVQGTGH